MNEFSGNKGGCVDFMSYLVQNSVAMVHPDIRALERYWQDLRAGRPCPYRAEVDPRDIRSRIGNLFILEDLGLGNVRFRIAGTALVDAFGMELRGMPVRAIMEMRTRQSFAELLTETLAEPGVGYARLRRTNGRGEPWEIVLLPLRSDQGRIDRIIGALHSLDPVEGDTGDPQLRFTIEEMSITPVDVSQPAAAPDVETTAGFSETGAVYTTSETQSRPALTAIEGGGETTGDDQSPSEEVEARRSSLRIISND